MTAKEDYLAALEEIQQSKELLQSIHTPLTQEQVKEMDIIREKVAELKKAKFGLKEAAKKIIHYYWTFPGFFRRFFDYFKYRGSILSRIKKEIQKIDTSLNYYEELLLDLRKNRIKGMSLDQFWRYTEDVYQKININPSQIEWIDKAMTEICEGMTPKQGMEKTINLLIAMEDFLTRYPQNKLYMKNSKDAKNMIQKFLSGTPPEEILRLESPMT